MAALVAEDLDEEVGAAVDDLGLVGEAGRRVDEAGELDDADEPVEVAVAGGPDLGDEVQAAGPGRRGAGVNVDAVAEAAEDQPVASRLIWPET